LYTFEDRAVQYTVVKKREKELEELLEAERKSKVDIMNELKVLQSQYMSAQGCILFNLTQIIAYTVSNRVL
jgi:hypothetical protein